MKRTVVLEHRQALDAMEHATSVYNGCRRKGDCSDTKECLKCPAYIEKNRCQVILDEKSAKLQKINEQIVIQNDALALRQREESKQKRQQREEKKQAKMQAQASMKKEEVLKPMASNEKVTAVSTESLTRKDLTAARYQNHKSEGKLSDDQIAKMYNIPKGSFTKIKKDLLGTGKTALKKATPTVQSNVATEELNLLQEKLDKLETNYASTVKEKDELEARYNSVCNELSLSKEMNKIRQDTIKSLEAEIMALQVTPPITMEQDASKALPEHVCERHEEIELEINVYKDRSEKRLQTIERLQDQISSIIITHNQQVQKFQDYEKYLLERILHLLTQQ